MLQEKYLKNADVYSSQSIEIKASPDKVFPIIDTLSFEHSKVIYWLFRLRGLPVPESLSLKGLEKLNFIKLEARPNQETILGIIGQFWTISGKLKKIEPDDFITFHDANYAKGTWSFELVEVNSSLCKLKTVTRVHCPTKETKQKFKIYWHIIQPFSLWIRREILKSIKQQAETSS